MLQPPRGQESGRAATDDEDAMARLGLHDGLGATSPGKGSVRLLST